MLNLLKKLFSAKPAPVAETVPEVPYKVETPAPTVAEQATQAAVESIAPKAPAKKKPAAPKKPAGEKKPAAPKKPRTKSKPKA